MYVPVSALFFFIGSCLFAYYQTRPEDSVEIRRIVAHQRLMQQGVDAGWTTRQDGQRMWSEEYDQQVSQIVTELKNSDIGDRVFRIHHQLTLPASNRVVDCCHLFAAGMSTVSTSLNSSATLVMSDFYRPLLAPEAGERQLVRVLYIATLVWGFLGTATAFALIPLTQSVLDVCGPFPASWEADFWDCS